MAIRVHERIDKAFRSFHFSTVVTADRRRRNGQEEVVVSIILIKWYYELRADDIHAGYVARSLRRVNDLNRRVE